MAVPHKEQGSVELWSLVPVPYAPHRLRRHIIRLLCTDLGRRVFFPAFDEAGYLKRNKDVRTAVDNGVHRSGYEHFIRYGRKENRTWACDAPIATSHAYKDYKRLVQYLLKEYPDNEALAMAKSVGSQTMECFYSSGNKQVSILRHFGLLDHWAVYDLSCGCGRTAQALARNGWSGRYVGADIIEEFISYAQKTTPGFLFLVHHNYTVAAEDSSLDLVFAWSLFTHLLLEETSLYIEDAFRSLRPGGKLIFSFLELAVPHHRTIFDARRALALSGKHPVHLDFFLNRHDIETLASSAGFQDWCFIDGDDRNATPYGALGQSVAVLTKV